MLVKGIQVEDFVNYKECSMFISMGTCDWKCCIEGGFDKSICQNEPIAKLPDTNISNDKIIQWFMNNPLSKALVIGGLEPFTYFSELLEFIKLFRSKSNAIIVIYTGYRENEVEEEIKLLQEYKNIIVKFGRFELGHEPHYDDVLGVNLASDNQYGKRIS